VNKTELALLGYRSSEMVGRHVWDFVVEAASQQVITRKLAGGANVEEVYQRTFRRKNGSLFPVLVRDRLIRERDQIGDLVQLGELPCRLDRAGVLLRDLDPRVTLGEEPERFAQWPREGAGVEDGEGLGAEMGRRDRGQQKHERHPEAAPTTHHVPRTTHGVHSLIASICPVARLK
jgi:hypothetical protein